MSYPSCTVVSLSSSSCRSLDSFERLQFMWNEEGLEDDDTDIRDLELNGIEIQVFPDPKQQTDTDVAEEQYNKLLQDQQTQYKETEYKKRRCTKAIVALLFFAFIVLLLYYLVQFIILGRQDRANPNNNNPLTYPSSSSSSSTGSGFMLVLVHLLKLDIEPL